MTDLYLLGIDIQKDFCPGGSLAVPEGDLVVEPWNAITHALRPVATAVIFSRDFHPPVTNHFNTGGGDWPPHCVRGTAGAAFHDQLEVAAEDIIISKGVAKDDPGYSAYRSLCGTIAIKPEALFLVGGLAIDYCVKATVLDLLAAGWAVKLVPEALRAVDASPGGSGESAWRQMMAQGAKTIGVEEALSRYRDGVWRERY